MSRLSAGDGGQVACEVICGLAGLTPVVCRVLQLQSLRSFVLV